MLYAIVGVLVLLADQFLKYWTITNLELNTGIRELIPGVFQLTYIRNYGAVFGLLQNASWLRWALLALLILFTAGMLLLFFRGVLRTGLSRWTGALLLAGALGNGIDRAIYGYVVDMFEFPFARLPIFNLADCLILICGILFCLSLLLARKSGSRDLAEPEPASAPRRGRRADPFSDPEEGLEDPFAAGRVPTRKRSADVGYPEQPPVRKRPATGEYDEAPVRKRPATGEYGEAPVRKRPASAAYDDAPARKRPATGEYGEAPVRKRPAVSAFPDDTPARKRPASAAYDEAPARKRPAAAEYEEPARKRPAPAGYGEAPARKRPAPADVQEPAAGKAPAASSTDEFDLDSIMAEFK